MTEEKAIVNKLLRSILPKIVKFNKLTKLMKTGQFNRFVISVPVWAA